MTEWQKAFLSPCLRFVPIFFVGVSFQFLYKMFSVFDATFVTALAEQMWPPVVRQPIQYADGGIFILMFPRRVKSPPGIESVRLTL